MLCNDASEKFPHALVGCHIIASLKLLHAVIVLPHQGFRKNCQIKSFIILAVISRSVYELAGPISASLRPGNTAPSKEMSQRWRAVGNTVSDLTGPRFEPQTSRSRDERVTEIFHCGTIAFKAAFTDRAYLRAEIRTISFLM